MRKKNRKQYERQGIVKKKIWRSRKIDKPKKWQPFDVFQHNHNVLFFPIIHKQKTCRRMKRNPSCIEVGRGHSCSQFSSRFDGDTSGVGRSNQTDLLCGKTDRWKAGSIGSRRTTSSKQQKCIQVLQVHLSEIRHDKRARVCVAMELHRLLFSHWV